MYTASIEEETAFLKRLFENRDASMRNEKPRPITECPHCQDGTVFVRSTKKAEKNTEIREISYYCGKCGEVFRPSMIRSDILFRLPFEPCEALQTPFGKVYVKINGQIAPFRYRKKCYSFRLPSPFAPTALHLIDVDLRERKPGDRIFCGFERGILEAYDSDERSELLSCENDELFFALCAFEPENRDNETDTYCYRLCTGDQNGFEYEILADPQRYDAHIHYESSILRLALAWVKKQECVDPDLALFLSLTSEIG